MNTLLDSSLSISRASIQEDTTSQIQNMQLNRKVRDTLPNSHQSFMQKSELMYLSLNQPSRKSHEFICSLSLSRSRFALQVRSIRESGEHQFISNSYQQIPLRAIRNILLTSINRSILTSLSASLSSTRGSILLLFVLKVFIAISVTLCSL